MMTLLRTPLILIGLALASLAHAAGWPAKPIRMIHGFTPGGNVDITARIAAQILSEGLGQSVIVDGRPGAGGTLAANLVAKSEADGYTLFTMASGHSISPGLYRKLPYDAVGDFTMVSLISSFPFVIAVGANSPVKSIGDLIKLAKDKQSGATLAHAGPRNIPKPILTRIVEVLHKGLARPDVIERLRQLGTGAAPSQPAETQQYLASEVARWRKIVRDEKILYQD